MEKIIVFRWRICPKKVRMEKIPNIDGNNNYSDLEEL